MHFLSFSTLYKSTRDKNFNLTITPCCGQNHFKKIHTEASCITSIFYLVSLVFKILLLLDNIYCTKEEMYIHIFINNLKF